MIRVALEDAFAIVFDLYDWNEPVGVVKLGKFFILSLIGCCGRFP